ncbi:MAG TPA: class I SAM-dependent methyltransferase [Hyphomicrobiaceae bacterium]|nr:class I SAM-dependent methyltransferase [Hyphomicrobiaceae bacterium]
MSGFSAQWLDLREPADHRARNSKLARRLAQHFDGWRPITVVDLGCGTGSNLRATAPLLGPEQQWTLVDYEQALLDAAVARLTSWADAAAERDAGLELFKGAKRISVNFRRADLTRDLGEALGLGANLITASALFDLASATFIESFVAEVAARRAVFYTVLTYDGDQRWTPEHEADAAMLSAFHAHQATDKGFGPAAGPEAPDLLGAAFQAANYTVLEGDSAWRLETADGALIGDLAAGFAQAARETGMVEAAAINSWAAVARTGAIVGHTDTLALPG